MKLGSLLRWGTQQGFLAVVWPTSIQVEQYAEQTHIVGYGYGDLWL